MEFAASISSYDYGYTTPIKEIHWLASVFSGIILCFLVYKSTALLSSLLFKEYGKLSRAKRIEWNNRGFSTFHALLVSFASFYLLIISDIFSEDSHEELVIYRSSTLSNTVLGISIGYFIADLAMILWHFPALGGLEYVLHHGLSMFSIILSLLSGQVQIYILMVLFSEMTTPFVNLRWYLDAAGLKNSKLYIVNGVALFLGWLVARIILFMFLFFHMWYHFDEVNEVFPLGFYCLLVVSPVLAMLNIFWFWKIVKGLVKTLTRAKTQQVTLVYVLLYLMYTSIVYWTYEMAINCFSTVAIFILFPLVIHASFTTNVYFERLDRITCFLFGIRLASLV